MDRRSQIRVAIAAAALAAALPLEFLAAARAEEKAVSASEKRPPKEFTLESRIEVLEERGDYPCTDCHDGVTQKTNARERELEEEHDALELNHGGGRFWCMSCHHKDDRDALVDMKGRKVSLDASHELCLQCHSERKEDFARGGHGKRYGTWQGERNLKACVECHNPHAPGIKQRNPVALPTLRKGLVRPAAHHTSEKPKPWVAARESRGWPEPTPESVKPAPEESEGDEE